MSSVWLGVRDPGDFSAGSPALLARPIESRDELSGSGTGGPELPKGSRVGKGSPGQSRSIPTTSTLPGISGWPLFPRESRGGNRSFRTTSRVRSGTRRCLPRSLEGPWVSLKLFRNDGPSGLVRRSFPSRGLICGYCKMLGSIGFWGAFLALGSGPSRGSGPARLLP